MHDQGLQALHIVHEALVLDFKAVLGSKFEGEFDALLDHLFLNHLFDGLLEVVERHKVHLRSKAVQPDSLDII